MHFQLEFLTVNIRNAHARAAALLHWCEAKDIDRLQRAIEPIRCIGIATAFVVLHGCTVPQKPSNASTGPTRIELFDLKTNCSKIAAEFEPTGRADWPKDFTFSNHYDSSDNKCYAELQGIGSTRLRRVYDAQERKVILSCTQDKGDDPHCVDESWRQIEPKHTGEMMDKLMSETDGWPD